MAKGKIGGKRAFNNWKNNISDTEIKMLEMTDAKKDFYYEKNIPSQREREMLKDEFKNGNYNGRDTLKYEAVLVNENLPKLIGSDKQIAWAESIRNNAIASQIDQVTSKVNIVTNGSNKYAKRDAFMSQVSNTFNTNVDTFSDAVNIMLNENKNGAFNYFKNTTSAKEIIDNRNKW